VKLSAKLRTLLLQGVEQAGSYEPDEALMEAEEYMTSPEYSLAFAFLTWVSINGYKFGQGNIDTVFAYFVEAH
jgi:hypothetical protein